MQVKALILASIASVALAQTTSTTSAAASTTSSSCAAQNILDACEATIQGQINSCASTDYSCLCTQYGNMLQCYANCPNDPTVGTVQQQRQQNCNAASVYGSTTTLGTASGSATMAATSTTSSDASAQTGFASGSNTASGSSASSTSSSSGADVTTVNGLFALLAAGLAAFL